MTEGSQGQECFVILFRFGNFAARLFEKTNEINKRYPVWKHIVSDESNYFNPFTPKRARFKTEEKILNFILQNYQKETAPLESTAQ